MSLKKNLATLLFFFHGNAHNIFILVLSLLFLIFPDTSFGKTKSKGKEKSSEVNIGKSRVEPSAISSNSKECVVILDPGHGGKDVGAIGAGNIYEKDVALDIGKKLKELIRKNGFCGVIMTRETDVFVSLSERAEIANSSNGSLFMSIHANASKKISAKGIETYFQGHPKTQEEKETAARENIDFIKEEFRTKDDMLGFILADMKNTYLINESSYLAGVIQANLFNEVQDKYSETKNLGVKQALFYVLHGSMIPGILTEVSFITNPVEGKRLGSQKYRDLIAQALFKGIKAYLKNKTKLGVAQSDASKGSEEVEAFFEKHLSLNK